MRRFLCWLLGHNTFSFPSGAMVCRRCWWWWRVMV